MTDRCSGTPSPKQHAMKRNTATSKLALPFSTTDAALRQHIEAYLKRQVALLLTNNSTSMLSARSRDGVLRVRLHRMFLHADDRVLGEILSYLQHRKGAMPHFRSFIRKNRALLSSKPARKVPVRTKGRFHDLSGLYDELNRKYFGGAITAAITWGPRSPRAALRKRTVGSYSTRSNVIRINPVLDRKTVPRCYVALVVYHEMLHASLGVAMRGTRRSVHSREFRGRERLFQDYEQAMAWQLRNTPTS